MRATDEELSRYPILHFGPDELTPAGLGLYSRACAGRDVDLVEQLEAIFFAGHALGKAEVLQVFKGCEAA
jgi:hypothetical protein